MLTGNSRVGNCSDNLVGASISAYNHKDGLLNGPQGDNAETLGKLLLILRIDLKKVRTEIVQEKAFTSTSSCSDDLEVAYNPSEISKSQCYQHMSCGYLRF